MRKKTGPKRPKVSATRPITRPRTSIFRLVLAIVLGEFNNWPTTAAYLNKTPDGNNWWVQINGLTPGREYAYQYLVDGSLRVADPYCEKILDPNDDQYIPAVTYPNLKAYPTGQTTGIVSVLQTNQPPYAWAVTSFQVLGSQ